MFFMFAAKTMYSALLMPSELPPEMLSGRMSHRTESSRTEAIKSMSKAFAAEKTCRAAASCDSNDMLVWEKGTDCFFNSEGGLADTRSAVSSRGC